MWRESQMSKNITKVRCTMKNNSKRIVLLMVVFMVLILSSNSFAANEQPHVIQGVKVYIDGTIFQTESPFYNLNGFTLVPMRPIFEGLGAKVKWEQSTKTIVASTEERIIELTIDKDIAKINDKSHSLTVAPKLINNTTYVPLRFVAEALMYEVDWDSRNKAISIIDTREISKIKQLKVYETSLFFDRDFVKIDIFNNEKINVFGRTGLEKTGWLFSINNNLGECIKKEYNDISYNGTYEKSFSIGADLEEGDYKLNIYFKEGQDSLYWAYYWNIPLSYKDGEIFFPISPIYENNYIQYVKNSILEPNSYLDIDIANESERKEIKKLAHEITKDASNDYDKLIKINEWVAQNIYYDWDGYIAGNYGRTDAYGTLEARKSVCQGYAELTNALLRSIGIPSRVVSGHALGVSASGNYWDAVDHTESNHAWNEAYVDDRWIILDTTWNSGNKYEDGKFQKEAMSYRYFDPTLEVFSYTHKIIE